MKTFVKLLLILWWLFNITQAYVDEIDPYSWKSNIEKTILIEKYLIEHKTKIVNFSIKYNAEKDTEINNSIDKIDYLIESLNKIQNNNLDEETENLVITTILNEVKKVNDSLKTILKKKKNSFELNLRVKKDFYSNLWYKLSFKIEEIHSAMYDKKVYEKKILTERELKIKTSLKKLWNLAKDLKYFWNNQFNSEEEIKSSFIKILKDIKTQISILKTNI